MVEQFELNFNLKLNCFRLTLSKCYTFLAERNFAQRRITCYFKNIHDLKTVKERCEFNLNLI